MDYFMILSIFMMFKDIYLLYGELSLKNMCAFFFSSFALLYEKFRTCASTMENILIHVHAQDYEQDLNCY